MSMVVPRAQPAIHQSTQLLNGALKRHTGRDKEHLELNRDRVQIRVI